MNSARNRSVSTPHNAGESFSSSRIRGRRLILLAPSGARSLRPECYYGTARQILPSSEWFRLLHVGADFSPPSLLPSVIDSCLTKRLLPTLASNAQAPPIESPGRLAATNKNWLHFHNCAKLDCVASTAMPR